MFADWPETKLHHLLRLKFSITQNGFEAMLPSLAMEGDCLYHVHKDSEVLVLRPFNERPAYFLIIRSATVCTWKDDVPGKVS
jgi:hypothetical protein